MCQNVNDEDLLDFTNLTIYTKCNHFDDDITNFWVIFPAYRTWVAQYVVYKHKLWIQVAWVQIPDSYLSSSGISEKS